MSATPLFDLAPADFAALRRLLDEALALPPAERAAWLGRLPEEHAALRPRLEGLLAHADDSEDEAGRTAARFTMPRLKPQDEPGLPPDAGPYRATRLLGEGGMGRVWLAERIDMLHGRPVALKLPQAAWRHPNLAERMAQEREILAVLDHPNIARIYDAGVTADGQPWLALEYVEGQRIDDYIRARGLDAQARIMLFLQVMSAVAHAHARLVVHRDLKPGNILVTSDGQARLLDFGIAKLIAANDAAAAELTAPAQRALTPHYAAPEQILGQPIGTAADIYTLGVVLYELLTGELPYKPRRGTAAALEETIVSGAPPRPSQRATDARTRRTLAGDLDTVLLKALKKNPAERYATVQAFADDLRAWLDNRPVGARPDSAWYHARKFVQRNWLGVAVAGGFVLSLGAALGVALWQANEARAQAAKAGAITEFLVGLFRANDIEQAGGLKKREESVQQLLEHSAVALEQGLSDQPGVRADLRHIVGGLLADLEINDAAIRLQRAQAEDLAARRAPRADQVAAWRALGQSLFRASDFAGARSALDRARCPSKTAEDEAQCLGVALDRAQIDRFEGKLDAAQKAADPLPEALARLPGTGNDLADAYELLAQIRDLRNQPAQAREFFERALALRKQQWGEGSVRLAQMRYRFGRMLWNLRQLGDAVAEMSAAWQTTRAALGPEHVASARSELHLGRLQFYVGTDGEGMAHLRHAHDALLAQADRLDPLEVLTAQTFLANALVLDGRLREAGQALDTAEARRISLGGLADSSVLLDLSRAMWLADTGHLREARAIHERLRDSVIARLGERHPYVAERRQRLALVMLMAGEAEAADRELQAALATDDGIETVFGSAKHRASLAQAISWADQGRGAPAAAQMDELLALAARTERRELYRETFLMLQETAVVSFAAAGRHDDALRHCQPFIDAIEPAQPNHPWLAALRARCASSLMALGRMAEARQQLDKAGTALRAEPLAGTRFKTLLQRVEQEWARRASP